MHNQRAGNYPYPMSKMKEEKINLLSPFSILEAIAQVV